MGSNVASKFITLAFALGVVALTVAFVIPPMIEAPHEPTERTESLAVSEQGVLNDNLQIMTTAINETDGTATVEVTDRSAGAVDSATLSESQSATLSLPDGDVTVTLESIPNGDTATLTTSYPSTYGFSAGGKAISENIGVLLVALSLILITGIVAMAVNV